MISDHPSRGATHPHELASGSVVECANSRSDRFPDWEQRK